MPAVRISSYHYDCNLNIIVLKGIVLKGPDLAQTKMNSFCVKEKKEKRMNS